MRSSNGNIFCVTGPLWGEFTCYRWIQRPVTQSFDVFFDLHPNKGLGKQPWGWWFETSSHSLWRHYNEVVKYVKVHSSHNFLTMKFQDSSRTFPEHKPIFLDLYGLNDRQKSVCLYTFHSLSCSDETHLFWNEVCSIKYITQVKTIYETGQHIAKPGNYDLKPTNKIIHWSL